MKRYLYLFPLMAFTAATLTLAACDDKKDAEQDQAAMETVTTPVEETAAVVAPVAAVTAEGATAYATAADATTGAVFLTLHNPGATADKLVGVTSAAGTAEIHETYVDPATGTASMRKVESVEVPAGGMVELKSDGYHIMLLSLAKPLVAGETFDVTLDFETAADVTVPVTITAPAAATTTETTTEAPSATTDTSVPSDTTATDTTTTTTDPVVDEVPPAPSETPAEAPAADGHSGH